MTIREIETTTTTTTTTIFTTTAISNESQIKIFFSTYVFVTNKMNLCCFFIENFFYILFWEKKGLCFRKTSSLNGKIHYSEENFFYEKTNFNIKTNWRHEEAFTLGVNFTNILRAALAPIFLCLKSTDLKCKYRKAAQKAFVWKSCS